jgi:hypothetical protein
MSDNYVFEFEVALDKRDVFIARWLHQALISPDPVAWVLERVGAARRRLDRIHHDPEFVEAAVLELDMIERDLLAAVAAKGDKREPPSDPT